MENEVIAWVFVGFIVAIAVINIIAIVANLGGPSI